MPNRPSGEVRVLALVGPTGSGKTTLMEAMLAAAGETDRRVGDQSPEAKARGHSVELNLAGFNFMGERYAVVDCPGSLELAAEADAALPAVDLAVIVADPDPAIEYTAEPPPGSFDLIFCSYVLGGLEGSDLTDACAYVSGALDRLLFLAEHIGEGGSENWRFRSEAEYAAMFAAVGVKLRRIGTYLALGNEIGVFEGRPA